MGIEHGSILLAAAMGLSPLEAEMKHISNRGIGRAREWSRGAIVLTEMLAVPFSGLLAGVVVGAKLAGQSTTPLAFAFALIVMGLVVVNITAKIVLDVATKAIDKRIEERKALRTHP